MRTRSAGIRNAPEVKHVMLPEGVLKDDYVIVAVHPEMCRETTSKIYRRLTAVKKFEGRTIGAALSALSRSPTTPFNWFDMQCHVARERIVVKGIELSKVHDKSRPHIVDANAGVVDDWSGRIIGEAPRSSP